MPERFLDEGDIVGFGQEVRGEGVSQAMRRGGARDSGNGQPVCKAAVRVPGADAGEHAPLAAPGQVPPHHLRDRLRKVDALYSIPFGPPEENLIAFEVNICGIKCRQLPESAEMWCASGVVHGVACRRGRRAIRVASVVESEDGAQDVAKRRRVAW